MNIEPELTVREALSGVSGSVSITAWIFLLLPQLYENYTNSSADALSVTFLIVWFLGDVTNLIGAVWDGLLGTVIAIAIYFCFIDVTLIAQTFYYKLRNTRPNATASLDGTDRDDPSRPLLSDGSGERPLLSDSPNGEAPRRESMRSIRRTSAAGSLPYVKDVDEGPSAAARWTRNLLAVLAVCAIGTAAWALAWQLKWWKPTPPGEEGDEARILGAEIFGYASALLYLGARIPQIWKNYREKSCEGLSLLFFMLSTLGNITYGTQILFHSTSAPYVVKNLPWLIGSLGTIAEDIIIFIQFQIYARRGDENDNTAVVD